MFPAVITFTTAVTFYYVILGGAITDKYSWQKLPIVPEAPPNPFESSRGVNLPLSCGYMITYSNDYNLTGFDVTIQIAQITPSQYLWTLFNWTGGNWTLYIGSQIYGCDGSPKIGI